MRAKPETRRLRHRGSAGVEPPVHARPLEDQLALAGVAGVSGLDSLELDRLLATANHPHCPDGGSWRDARAMRIRNAPEAEQSLGRDYREGWKLA